MKVLDTLMSVAVIAAALAVLWAYVGPDQTAPPAPERSADIEGVIPAALAQRWEGDGPLVLVEALDYQCPACGVFARDVRPTLDLPVQIVTLHFPLPNHPHAEAAAIVAECAAEQGQFAAMSAALFADQASWGTGDFSAPLASVTLDVDALATCRAGEAAARVRANRDAVRALSPPDRSFTPTFFLGERRPDGSIAVTRRYLGWSAEIVADVQRRAG